MQRLFRGEDNDKSSWKDSSILKICASNTPNSHWSICRQGPAICRSSGRDSGTPPRCLLTSEGGPTSKNKNKKKKKLGTNCCSMVIVVNRDMIPIFVLHIQAKTWDFKVDSQLEVRYLGNIPRAPQLINWKGPITGFPGMLESRGKGFTLPLFARPVWS